MFRLASGSKLLTVPHQEKLCCDQRDTLQASQFHNNLSCQRMPALDESVIEFVVEFTGVRRQRLALTSTLFGDLGVDSADGWEFIEKFGQKFQVDLTAFRAEQHFGPEGLPIHAPFVWFWSLVSWPFRKLQTPEEQAGLRAIHISDLIAAAKEKRWTL